MSDSITDAVMTATRGFLSDASEIGQDLVDAAFRRGRDLFPRRNSSCDIPEPCWMPKRLDTVRSHVCPGATATLRVQLTNCGLETRSIRVGAPYDTDVTVQPAVVTLRAFESAVVDVSYTLPGDTQSGGTHRVLVVVVGCRAYVADWTITADGRCGDSIHEIEIEDCPDLVHHWYDHFYCRRPCLHSSTQGKVKDG